MLTFSQVCLTDGPKKSKCYVWGVSGLCTQSVLSFHISAAFKFQEMKCNLTHAPITAQAFRECEVQRQNWKTIYLVKD